MNPETLARSGSSLSSKGAAAWLSVLLAALAFAGCFGEAPPECELLTWDGYEITITKLDGSEETRQVEPSPEGLDADGDEVDDCVEFHQRTDPNDPDSSGDGLLDGLNVTLEEDDPRAEEWLERAIAHEETDDGQIVFFGSHAWGLDPTMQDTVGSGILDGEEVAGFSVWILGEERVVRTDPNQRDTSGDGMFDGDKRRLGLDPTLRDMDGDGVPDHDDLNPWVDFELRLSVDSLTLKEDPHGRSQRNLWLSLRLPGDEFQSPPNNQVTVGETADGEPFSSPTLTPGDAGGSIQSGQHNTTFTISAFSQEDGDPVLLDFFSQTVGTSSLVGEIQALTGELFHGQGASEPWPSSATFEGEHGNITLRLMPVWPDDWQACVDNGCRHGDGEFQWR